MLGQYGPNADGSKPGYLDDDTVPPDSVCPTFASSVMWIPNERWRGVPFVLKAGKATDAKKVEIRVQFKKPAHGVFSESSVSSLSSP